MMHRNIAKLDIKTALSMAFTLVLCACESNTDALSPNPDEPGLSGNFQIDLANNTDVAIVEGAIFIDRIRVPIVAGDVLVASSDMEEVILRNASSEDSRYRNSLTIDSPDDTINFSIEHRPIEARAERWYPVDELLVDPGPSELVGLTANANFPAAINIDTPLNGSNFNGLNTAVQIRWSPFNEAEPIRISSFYTCTDGDLRAEGAYVSAELNDDGEETINIDTLVNSGVENRDNLIEFFASAVAEAAFALIEGIMITALEIAFFGLIDFGTASSSSTRFSLDNPEQCDINLRVLRIRDGTLDSNFNSGNVKASRSDAVDITYDFVP